MRTLFRNQFSIFILLTLLLTLAATRHAPAQSLAQDIEELVLDYQKLSHLKQILSDAKASRLLPIDAESLPLLSGLFAEWQAPRQPNSRASKF